MLEGDPATLIDQGKIRHTDLARELMTESELATVLHRQGFDTVSEVEKCILEPGGTFYITGKTPRAEQRRHEELMRAMKEIRERLDRIAPATHKG